MESLLIMILIIMMMIIISSFLLKTLNKPISIKETPQTLIKFYTDIFIGSDLGNPDY